MAWWNPSTWVIGEDLPDGLGMEDADQQAQIKRTHYDYVEYENLNQEEGEEVGPWPLHTWNCKHRWWMR